MLLCDFVEHALGFRNVGPKLQRAALRSPGGTRLVPHSQSWLRHEEVRVLPHRAFKASQAYQGRVLAKLMAAVAGEKWLFTGWCRATRQEVKLTLGDFEHERVVISMNLVGRTSDVKVVERNPSREELIIEAIEELCRNGSPGSVGSRRLDIHLAMEARFRGLGKGEFLQCWKKADLEQGYRDGGKPKGTKHSETE